MTKLKKDHFEKEYNQEHIAESTDFVKWLVRGEINKFGGDSKRVLIGGFSIGCTIALNTYL